MKDNWKIELSCRRAEWWRYNVTAICGAFDAAGGRVGFASADSTVAPVGSNLAAAPEGCAAARRVALSVEACRRIVAYIYIIPHSLPLSREIDETLPFEVSVRIVSPDGRAETLPCRVNAWSGASIEIKRECAGCE